QPATGGEPRNAKEDSRHSASDDDGRIVSPTALVPASAARPGRSRRLQGSCARGGLHGRRGHGDPRAGRSRSRHRDDGNMWYDDYVGVIGSFCWYLYERIPGFEPARNPHPSYAGADPSQGKTIMDDWGGVIVSGPVDKEPDKLRWGDLYQIASRQARVPVKVSVGAGPANLAWHVYLNQDTYYK